MKPQATLPARHNSALFVHRCCGREGAGFLGVGGGVGNGGLLAVRPFCSACLLPRYTLYLFCLPLLFSRSAVTHLPCWRALPLRDFHHTLLPGCTLRYPWSLCLLPCMPATLSAAYPARTALNHTSAELPANMRVGATVATTYARGERRQGSVPSALCCTVRG